MPRKPALPAIGECVGGWRIHERLADEIRTDRNNARTARFRVRCANCTKQLVLRVTDMPRRACTACLRAQRHPQGLPFSEAALSRIIRSAYRVRVKICGALKIAPPQFADFESYYLEHPKELLEALPVKPAADHEQRNYSPLYAAE